MPSLSKATAPSGELQYLTGKKLATVFSGMLLSVFLYALDQTIVATAQPKIVSQFHALDRIAWISSAYFLTQAGLILAVGQIMTIASSKYVFLVAIAIFELGSLFCAVAPDMDFLIFGRAVQGAGAAGTLVGVLSIIAEVTRLEDRPLLFGSFSAVFAVAGVTGPLIGGALADHTTWRWCFYVNLPFGAITIGTVALFLRTKSGSEKRSIFAELSPARKWLSLDWVGTIIALGFATSLILALQWGGNTKPWNSRDVIISFVFAGVLFIIFFAWEYYIGTRAMLPLALLKRRTQVGCAFMAGFGFATTLVMTYYLPLWYQAKGATASRSGVNILAFILSLVVATALASVIVKKTGRYWFFAFFPPLIASVGAGLLFTIHPSTPNTHIIGFQILVGVGWGAATQQAIIATQAEYAHEPHLIPQGTSVVNVVQVLGGVLGIAIGSAIFQNGLVKSLPRFAPDLTLEQFAAVRSSVTAIFILPKELQSGVIDAFSYSLNRVFLIGVVTCACSSLSALLIKNYNIHERSVTAVKRPQTTDA